MLFLSKHAKYLATVIGTENSHGLFISNDPDWNVLRGKAWIFNLRLDGEASLASHAESSAWVSGDR